VGVGLHLAPHLRPPPLPRPSHRIIRSGRTQRSPRYVVTSKSQYHECANMIQANKKPKVMENKAIWISHLPPDTTKKELEEEFSRYGIIDKGANGEPRIRLEEKDGVFTGNAMIVYFKKEAIANAVRLMDDYPLRLGDTTNGNIHVEPASIETKKERDGDKIASKLTRKDRKASERNRAELNRYVRKPANLRIVTNFPTVN
jgi:RNA recognition motif-containing protein